jgi:hypothetical protein
MNAATLKLPACLRALALVAGLAACDPTVLTDQIASNVHGSNTPRPGDSGDPNVPPPKPTPCECGGVRPALACADGDGVWTCVQVVDPTGATSCTWELECAASVPPPPAPSDPASCAGLERDACEATAGCHYVLLRVACTPAGCPTPGGVCVTLEGGAAAGGGSAQAGSSGPR